jgi:hypothetical protein
MWLSIGDKMSSMQHRKYKFDVYCFIIVSTTFIVEKFDKSTKAFRRKKLFDVYIKPSSQFIFA